MTVVNSSVRLWLVTSLVAFFCCVLAVSLLVAFAQRISQYGLAQSLFYIILIVAGLLASGFLFGALRSYGKYKGKLLSGTLELGGPAVVALLIVLLGLHFASPTSTFTLVVRPHGPAGDTDLLRNGTVTVFFGTDPRTAEIGNNGQAQFNEVPYTFLGSSLNVAASIPGYVAATTARQQIPEDRILYFPMKPDQSSSVLAGVLLTPDDGPVIGAHLTVNHGLATGATNQEGQFSILVPLKEGTVVNLTADLRGKVGYDNTVTVSDSLTLTFLPGPVKHRPLPNTH